MKKLTLTMMICGILITVNHGFAQENLRDKCQELSASFLDRGIDPAYHTYLEVYAFLDSIVEVYPDITRLDTSWRSQFLELKIPVLKISDNPEMEEDEPAIGYDGIMHPGEVISLEICLKIIEILLSNYGTDPQITSWVDNCEIFILPMWNPDGWKYQFDSVCSPPWRKNLHDNDSSGSFEPEMDGVQLNRNFDYYWENSTNDPTSKNYRGLYAFSEKETQLKRKLAREQKYVLSINNHSYGEMVIWGGSTIGAPNPEFNIMYRIADSLSKRLPESTGTGHYWLDPEVCDAGYSDCWMTFINGSLEFVVESALVLPSGTLIQQIATDNALGELYLFERVFGPGITGHVTDSITGDPLIAWIKVVEIYDPVIEPRKSDSLYGRFFRMLNPGVYNVEVIKEGYDTAYVNDIVVSDTLTYFDVQLKPQDPQKIIEVGPDKGYEVKAHPNPFRNSVQITLSNACSGSAVIDVYSASGRVFAEFHREERLSENHIIDLDMSELPGGMYYVRIQSGKQISFAKLIKLN